MKNNLVLAGLIALIVSISSIGVFTWFSDQGKTVKIEHIDSTPSQRTLYTIDENGTAAILDFNEAAEKVINGVVHIKSTFLYRSNRDQLRKIPDPFRDFFGDEFEDFFGPRFKDRDTQKLPQNAPSRVGTGSGVIISEDGYIVTNNHVIADADDLEVTLYDNRTYKAAVVGTDPSTDLALIQIKEKNLPTVPLVNSDEVKIGQWVLAVGNPMGLNSTVTAGIISAKGRNINILRDKYAIENFIQTDAAINPGNSGGALVNLNGGLVGINTAIASPTGTFAGYGFAVPANIVNKIVKDLLEYGSVQRGVLGVLIRTVDGSLSKEKDLSISQGVYVDSILENSAAASAGIQVGDIILSVNETEVKTSPELQGYIARYRPGEKVKIMVDRKGKIKTFEVTLKNREGSTDMVSKDDRDIIKVLGADFENISDDLADELDIKGGVQVTKLYPGKIRKFTDMRQGFIITKVDGKEMMDSEKLIKYLENKKGGVMLEGVYEDIPGEYYYAFGL